MLSWPLPWWLGAMALSAITIGFWLWMGRPLGVSACWTRLVTARQDARLREGERAVAASPDAFLAAMLAATRAEFGAAAVAETPLPQPAGPTPSLEQRAPWTAHLTFLLCLAVGGLLGALSRGSFELRATLGPEFERLFGSGWRGLLTLLAGGVLVGFGTRMCGGCSSGHGLSGCSRLQPGSLVATAAFFGGGVAAALLLARLWT